MDQGFSDIRCAVGDALAEQDKDKGQDLCVVDLGTDWVVYEDPDTVGAGLHRRGYQIDADGNVKFTSAPVAVLKQTSYNETQPAPKTFKQAEQTARQRFGRPKGRPIPATD